MNKRQRKKYIRKLIRFHYAKQKKLPLIRKLHNDQIMIVWSDEVAMWLAEGRVVREC